MRWHAESRTLWACLWTRFGSNGMRLGSDNRLSARVVVLMAQIDTLPEILRPLMDGPSIKTPYCAVCGRSDMPLNQHHIVRRGAGKLYLHGVEVRKPTITLCGSGNTCGCHGLAHQNRLHFRWVPKPSGRWKPATFGSGWWEFLVTDEPTSYPDALDMDGWRKLRKPSDF